MKTQTLLIAAAALAAGVISSQAQTPVYSANIVGYVNTTLSGNNALTFIDNPLLGAGGTNAADKVLTGLQGGEVLYVWNGSSFYQYVYAAPSASTGTGAGFPSNFYDQNGGAAGAIPGGVYDANNGVYWTPVPQIAQGQGVFVQNPNSTFTNTFLGSVVLQNTNTPVLLAGNNALTYTASTAPIAGNIEGTNFNLPFVGGEVVYVWNGSSYYQYVYAAPSASTGTGAGFPSNFYDQNGGAAGSIPGGVFDSNNGVYWTPPLVINVGQGFAIQNPNSAETWKQNLTVQ